mmetsp:Transcript_2563/g.4804  ORF Transcript_2563/g.4804 Transcript_2563/m.4804 type:complete len:224 (-) Transcript_2563:1019-1690(-)
MNNTTAITTTTPPHTTGIARRLISYPCWYIIIIIIIIGRIGHLGHQQWMRGWILPIHECCFPLSQYQFLFRTLTVTHSPIPNPTPIIVTIIIIIKIMILFSPALIYRLHPCLLLQIGIPKHIHGHLFNVIIVQYRTIQWRSRNTMTRKAIQFCMTFQRPIPNSYFPMKQIAVIITTISTTTISSTTTTTTTTTSTTTTTTIGHKIWHFQKTFIPIIQVRWCKT